MRNEPIFHQPVQLLVEGAGGGEEDPLESFDVELPSTNLVRREPTLLRLELV
jgi:hypothetical protein